MSFIHVSGLCTTRFSVGKRGDPVALGHFDGIRSVDAVVDQTHDMGTATADLARTLDAHCTGDQWCYLYGYSNGGAVISRALSLYDDDRWNVLWVLTVASNEGGSELSGSFVADVGDVLGITCDLSNNVGPTEHRAGWDHDDTGGVTFYQMAGHREYLLTGKLPDFFGGQANDGAVPYHSAGGLNDTWFVSDDDPWLCYAPDWHFDQHVIAGACRGYDRNHDQMQRKGIEDLGG
ncbi:MAG: hypothetical protein R3F60_19635 [bacterium]